MLGMFNRIPLFLVAALSLSLVMSCNKKDNDDVTSTNIYSASTTSTQVTKFYLAANEAVLAHLDSVFFTIDPDRSVIYNADSLPMGTKVTALQPKVSFGSTVGRVEFRITGATAHADTTFSYTASSSDSVDFTGHVVMVVTSSDGSQKKAYEVKVNVHKTKPDSLYWNRSARRDLPGVTTTPLAQKTVCQNGRYLCLLNNGGQFVLSSATHPAQGTWEKSVLDLPFTPVVESFTATPSALYLLDTDGNLYTSSDGTSWTDCSVAWHSIVGAYGDKLLGVLSDGGTFKHDEYPRDAQFTPVAIEAAFPVSDFSQLIEVVNTWSVSNQAIMVGGTTADGNATASVWGYDGTTWGLLSQNKALPALRAATLVSYYSYQTNSTNFKTTQNATWLLMGGRLSTGELNTTVYASTDQGITWKKADQGFQLPEFIPAFYGAQCFVHSDEMSAQGKAPRRAAPTQPVTSWQCPYVYLFGGYSSSGVLHNNVWQGVLIRMMFKPLY